jgi:hypothetical protein
MVSGVRIFVNLALPLAKARPAFVRMSQGTGMLIFFNMYYQYVIGFFIMAWLLLFASAEHIFNKGEKSCLPSG